MAVESIMSMEALITLFLVVSVLCIVFLIWLNTKSGKKWLSNL